MPTKPDNLPTILAGPILRHVSADSVVVWLATSTDAELTFCCSDKDGVLAKQSFPTSHECLIRIGEHSWLHLLQLTPDQSLPSDEWLYYDIGFTDANTATDTLWLKDIAPHLLYPNQPSPSFMLKSRLDTVLHGSCRKPHHRATDALLVVDELLANARNGQQQQPALLMMSGDQVYADDVACPTLIAIQQVTDLLGLYDEEIAGLANVSTGRDLCNNPNNLYGRTKLLPDTKANAELIDRFFGGVRKPIFTSANADNHLITLAEVLAMYLLVWSPALWEHVDLSTPDNLADEHQPRYQSELERIQGFITGLAKVQRALANVPVYMIFDDHDVTDDWNLTRGWEESAYKQPFSRRIIGNALIGYLLCQGWGNAPERFPAELIDQSRKALRQHSLSEQASKAVVQNSPGDQARKAMAQKSPDEHDTLIDQLLDFQQWHYTLDTTPKMVVLDSRTRRWRSERSAAQPSGLMDWEALTEMQQELIGEKAVVLVSSAPIFGVKLIEVVQRVFAWFGRALMVDAENWMSHRGAADVILNIFRHPRTPHNFVILSGDVHYSFAYDVRLRRREETPHIWQITSSGIKNNFPARLLRIFDRSNRWLFAGRSPLNWLTRRRDMHIRPRRPSKHDGRYRHQRLFNGNGIGYLQLNEAGEPTRIDIHCVDGKLISFVDGYDEDWH